MKICTPSAGQSYLAMEWLQILFHIYSITLASTYHSLSLLLARSTNMARGRAAGNGNFPDLAEFDAIMLVNIGLRFKGDKPAMIRWLRRYGLLADHMDCPCGSACREQNYARSKDGITWRCSNKACKKTINIRKGSFFEESHLHLWQVLGLTYIWSTHCGRGRGPSYEIVIHNLDGITL